jgi:hypothetical protein
MSITTVIYTFTKLDYNEYHDVIYTFTRPDYNEHHDGYLYQVW